MSKATISPLMMALRKSNPHLSSLKTDHQMSTVLIEEVQKYHTSLLSDIIHLTKSQKIIWTWAEVIAILSCPNKTWSRTLFGFKSRYSYARYYKGCWEDIKSMVLSVLQKNWCSGPYKDVCPIQTWWDTGEQAKGSLPEFLRLLKTVQSRSTLVPISSWQLMYMDRSILYCCDTVQSILEEIARHPIPNQRNLGRYLALIRTHEQLTSFYDDLKRSSSVVLSLVAAPLKRFP